MSTALYKTMLNAKDNMLKLREDGYTNAEIAQQLGISYNTVLRYIGRNSPGMRRAPARSEAARDLPAPKIETPPCLAVSEREIYLKGEFGSYMIQASMRSVLAELNGTTVAFTLDDLDKLIQELSAIRRNIGTFRVGAEMW